MTKQSPTTESLIRSLADRFDEAILVRLDLRALTDAEKSLVAKSLRLAAAVVEDHSK